MGTAVIQPWYRLGSQVPTLSALGGAKDSSDVADWLAPLDGAGGPLADATRVREIVGGELLRARLPGTPTANGGRRGAPRGVGTGHILVWRFQVAGWEARTRAIRATLTRPRSASAGERAWNLACVLLGAGVETPDLLAVGALRGARSGFGSFLIARDLEGAESLLSMTAGELPADERERVARSVVSALGRAWTAGLRGLDLSPGEIFVTSGGGCGPGNRLPGIALRGFSDARETAPLSPRWVGVERKRFLAGLEGCCSHTFVDDLRDQFEVAVTGA